MTCPVCHDDHVLALRILPRKTRFLIQCPACTNPEPMEELLEDD